MKPAFDEGGKFSKLRSVFEGFETFLFVPHTTSQSGTHIHDSIDSKRTMFWVIIALVPAMLFGMFNTGYQHYLATSAVMPGFWQIFFWGLLAVLPYIIVSYATGLIIEFIAAQIKGEEIQEGFLVSGLLIPLIVPIGVPLWMVAVATAFAVIFAKEVFGGTGFNILNVALTTRVFLFFAYPTKMSGDQVWVSLRDYFSYGTAQPALDAFTGATPLGQAAATADALQLTNALGEPLTWWDAFLGLIPGCIGETSTLFILLGGLFLLITGVASWKIVVSTFAGGAIMATIFNLFGAEGSYLAMPFWWHWCLGGFAFGAFFMATDPVTAARTEKGKWIYGLLVGMLAILLRVGNPAYPEGMMLSILLMNIFAKLIDYLVVQRNIKMRAKRAAKVNASK